MELGKIILDKLSQYNFLTNILPGTVLCILLHYLVGYNLLLSDYYLAGILFYFAGMVNSRFGSLVVEPLLKGLKIVVFAPYSDFVRAEIQDAKLTVISQENNTYRSYVSVMVLVLLAYLYKMTLANIEIVGNNEIVILLALLIVLFVCSYRKQTNYVRKRVEANLKNAASQGR